MHQIKILAQQSTKYLIASKYFLLEWIRWISPDGGGSSAHSFSRHCPPAWRKRRSAAFSRKYIAVFLAQEAARLTWLRQWMRSTGRDSSRASIDSQSRSRSRGADGWIHPILKKSELSISSKSGLGSFATIAAFPRSHPTIVSVEPSVIQRNRGPFQFRYERGMGNPR